MQKDLAGVVAQSKAVREQQGGLFTVAEGQVKAATNLSGKLAAAAKACCRRREAGSRLATKLKQLAACRRAVAPAITL